MRSTRSENFIPGFKALGVRQFGGALLKGNPRSARPLSTKRPVHLVMRSSMAIGRKSFLIPERAARIEEMVRRLGKHQGVKVYRFANGGNHLHLLVLPRSRKAFHNFVRSVSGVAARLSLGKERGKAIVLTKANLKRPARKDAALESQFWDARPFTRIVSWGVEYQITTSLLKTALTDTLALWTKQTFRESSA